MKNLYDLVELSKKLPPQQQEVNIAEDAKTANASALKLAEGMREHKKEQKPLQEATSAPVKPFLYS